MMANALKITVLLNILILMLVETTPLIREELLISKPHSGIDGGVAYISWLLFPLYYLPAILVALFITAALFRLTVR